MEFNKVSTKADLESLDQEDIVLGYVAAMNGEVQEPASDKSRGYWHGWRNGMVDRGYAKIDTEQQRLVRELYPNINPRLS